MVPQYYPWLFDDKEAWEKAITDPRYNYDLPIDYFMALYQEHRSLPPPSAPSALPIYAPMPVSSLFQSSSLPITQSLNAVADQVLSSFTPPATSSPESKSDDSVLSQDEIDALLAGLN